MNPAPSPPAGAPYTLVGRYAIFDEIASGGMATVHLGRLVGAAGFSRTVAIKRLHPQLSRDQEFASMFVDEARLASRIAHANVVQTLDVVPEGKEILLVMEYVHGVPFSHLLGTSRRTGWRVPTRIIASVMVGVLEGLHAAHEAKNEIGQPLGVVHRDVSPQNVLVGADGTARVIDFGVAKAIGKVHATRDGQLKGKLQYMSPEQVRGLEVTRASDVFAAAVMLWEALTSERLFDGKNPAELIMQVLSREIEPPRRKVPDLPEALDAVVMKGLAREPADRYATAREMAIALEEAAGGVAPAREVAEWVESMAGSALTERAKLLEAIERTMSSGPAAAARATDSGGSPLLADPIESGPRARPMPIAGALPADERSGPIARSDAAPALDETLASGPRRATRPAGGDLAPSNPPRDAAAPSPLDDAPARPREGARPHRIPVRDDADDTLDRSSLRARFAWPIRLIVAGVVISLADFGVRQAEIQLPFRPIWAAEVLVVVGVIWAFVLVALPAREE